MKKIVLAAVAAAAMTVPAAAQSGEGRIEARGGFISIMGFEKAAAGVGAGYDFDMGGSGFVGIDGGVEKVFVDGLDPLWTLAVRGGAKVGDKAKIYALGGRLFVEGTGAWFLGAGGQHDLGERTYVKLEYRRTIESGADLSYVMAGVGMKF